MLIIDYIIRTVKKMVNDTMKTIDLTMELDENTPIFPGDRKPVFKRLSDIEKVGYNRMLITMCNHFGTHIDFPSHVISGGKTSSDYDMEFFLGEVVIVDVRGVKEILPEHINVEIKNNDIVFICTGHSTLKEKKNYSTDYPVINPDTARYFVEKKVKIIGMDAPSPDTSPYNVHKILLGNGILIIENLVGLEKVKKAGTVRCECVILPLKLARADGAPCRVILKY